MNITKTLIEMMGSTLHVESVYGQGSIFYFSLKQRIVDSEPLGDYETAYRESVKENAVYHEKFIAPETDVLVVDDNDMNLKVFTGLLKRTRVRIDTAESGDECLQHTVKKKYDIIFLDHMMPGKDGIETLHELREQEGGINAETPVVCLTANAISGAKEEYIAAGFDDYLTKPIDPDRLENLMIRYLPDDRITLQEAEAEQTDTAADSRKLSELTDCLKGVDEIDIQLGLANHGGNIDTYLDTLRVFAASSDRYVTEIREFCQTGDLKNATIKIHALKSTSKIIGATDMGELAKKLEDAGKAEDKAVLDEELEGLLERTQTVGAALAHLPESEEENDDSELPEIDSETLQKYMDKIREFADRCDDVEIEELLDEIAAYQLPAEDRKRIKNIKKALDEFDFAAVVEALGKH